MKILFIGAVLDPSWRGGEPRIARILASSFSESGMSVSNLFLTRHRRKYMAEHAGLLSLVRKPYAYLAPEIDPVFVDYYRHEIRKVKPDVVMAWYDFDLSAFWASVLMKVPTITEALIFWPICPQLSLFNTLSESPCEGPSIYCDPCIKGAKRLGIGPAFWSMVQINRMNRLKCKLRYASAIISDSQYLKKKMVGSGYREKSIHVIHNGVDFGKIRPSYASQGEKIVLFLAVPDKLKGITHFVRLSEALKPEFPHVRFVWVGQKEVRGKAFETCDYVWNEKELYEIYNSAYLLLLPSLWPEPMSFTVLEAMAHGKPVVAYDIGANSEEIIHGQTGLLAPWGDIKQLQSHVRELLRNEKLARTMGQNARKLVEDRFSLEHMIGNYLGLLEAISESRSK